MFNVAEIFEVLSSSSLHCLAGLGVGVGLVCVDTVGSDCVLDNTGRVGGVDAADLLFDFILVLLRWSWFSDLASCLSVLGWL